MITEKIDIVKAIDEYIDSAFAELKTIGACDVKADMTNALASLVEARAKLSADSYALEKIVKTPFETDGPPLGI